MAHAPGTGPSTGLRTGILTFHRCINYGSYWQARCLVDGLRARGADAVLLDHDSPEVNRAEWRCAFQPLLPRRTPRSDFGAYAMKARGLLRAVGRLPCSRRFRLDTPQEMESFDCVLVGSDEVWNMHHPWYGGKPIFWGEGLKAGRIASYAASFGNHDAAEGLHPWWAEKLQGFSALSVRDDNSRDMLRGALGVEPELVLDPCLQFPPALPDAPADPVDAPYVAVYGHSFPGWYADAVKRWAARTGHRLVSIGYRNDWADEQRIAAGPEDFAALVAGAAAVATNFFHGCVFALLAARPFAAVASAYRANKLRDLTRTVGASPHLVEEGEDETRIARLLGRPLDPAVPARIEALRRRSDLYLAHALG